MAHPWIALASPFLLGAVIIGAIKGCEAYSKWRYERDRRVRNERLYRYGMQAFRGSKDRFLS
jgi:hypothetical protein